jgi:hypothetical protein
LNHIEEAHQGGGQDIGHGELAPIAERHNHREQARAHDWAEMQPWDDRQAFQKLQPTHEHPSFPRTAFNAKLSGNEIGHDKTPTQNGPNTSCVSDQLIGPPTSHADVRYLD